MVSNFFHSVPGSIDKVHVLGNTIPDDNCISRSLLACEPSTTSCDWRPWGHVVIYDLSTAVRSARPEWDHWTVEMKEAEKQLPAVENNYLDGKQFIGFVRASALTGLFSPGVYIIRQIPASLWVSPEDWESHKKSSQRPSEKEMQPPPQELERCCKLFLHPLSVFVKALIIHHLSTVLLVSACLPSNLNRVWQVQSQR